MEDRRRLGRARSARASTFQRKPGEAGSEEAQKLSGGRPTGRNLTPVPSPIALPPTGRGGRFTNRIARRVRCAHHYRLWCAHRTLRAPPPKLRSPLPVREGGRGRERGRGEGSGGGPTHA